MRPPRYRRLLTLYIVAAIVWGVIVQWPWGMWRFHALAALGAVHLIAPFWVHAVARVRPLSLGFLLGPLALAALDGLFIYYAWRTDLWRQLTIVFVPILAGAACVALLYAATVMTVLDRWRQRRERRADGHTADK